MYAYIALSSIHIPIHHDSSDDLDVILSSLNNYLTGNNNVVIGYVEQWKSDYFDNNYTFVYTHRWILHGLITIYFGTNTDNIQNLKESLTLERSLKLLFSKDLLDLYSNEIFDLSNMDHLGKILRFSNLSDPYLVLKSLHSISDDNMKQVCVYLLNNLVEMYKEEGEEVDIKNIPSLVTHINNHIYKGCILSSKLKAITTTYINMKISTATTIRLK